MRSLRTTAASLAIFVIGCGPAFVGTDGEPGDGSGGTVDGGVVFPDSRPVPDGQEAERLIYAHTDKTLYQADPETVPVTLTRIGDFDCIGDTEEPSSMNDLAVDSDGNLFGISASAVYPLEITGSTVHCVASWGLPSGARFYGLTFAPSGVLGSDEMLVAANSAGELWAISDAGATTQVGTFGLVPANDGQGHAYDTANVGKTWELSGDIVFFSHGGDPVGFATVRDCPDPPYTSLCNNVDTLVEIDVSLLALGNTGAVVSAVRGQVVKSPGCTDVSTTTGYGSMYGIAAWNDKVYGFSRAGYLVEISNANGAACMVEDYSPEKFAGAGVSTVAPIVIL